MVASATSFIEHPPEKYRGLILALQVKVLTLLVENPDRVVSTDDATENLIDPRSMGGKWVGPGINELSRLGYIRWVRAKRSARKSRRGTLLGTWRANVGKRELRAARDQLKAELDNRNAGLTSQGQPPSRQASIMDLIGDDSR